VTIDGQELTVFVTEEGDTLFIANELSDVSVSSPREFESKEFEEPLRKLSKTQGYILVKMIERETDRPMHDLIKELRGGLTATYWSTMGKMFGHELKNGYIEGENPILDIVLQDYDISHEVLVQD